MRAARTADDVVLLAADEGFGRGQPDELHAFFLRMGHFALRARHVGAVAAIEALHRLRALAHRGAHAIHRRVAAADDDDVLVLGVELAVRIRHRIAKSLAVAGDEIVERRHDLPRPAPGACISRAL